MAVLGLLGPVLGEGGSGETEVWEGRGPEAAGLPLPECEVLCPHISAHHFTSLSLTAGSALKPDCPVSESQDEYPYK